MATLNRLSEPELWRRYKAQPNERIREEILFRHNRLVYRLAEKYRHCAIRSGMEFGDIVIAGWEGLLRAFRRYEPGKGTTFNTYAYKFVRGYILEMFRDESNLIHISRNLVELNMSAEFVRERLAEEFGGEVPDEVIAGELGVSPERLETLQSIPIVVSFEQEVIQGGTGERPVLADTLATGEDIELDYIERENRERVKVCVSKLPLKLRDTIEKYYYRRMNMDRIGRSCGVSQSTVSNRRREALKRLRGMMEIGNR